MKSIRNSKGLYWGLIITFFVLYALVGFVSTLHSITFFELANTMWMAVLLGITYEVGQAAVLFSILMSDNNKKLLPWLLMIILTALQVTANVYASFKFMDSSGSNDWTFWQRSILFWLEADGPEMFKVVISWITGALLPVVALGMTALVAENLKLKDEHDKEVASEKDDDSPQGPDTTSTVKTTPKAAVEEELNEDYLYDLQSDAVDEKEDKTFDNQKNEVLQIAEELLKNKLRHNPTPKTVEKDPATGLEVIPYPIEIDLPPRNLSDPLKTKEEIPVDEIPEEKLSTNPRGKKVTKKPSNASRGWHLKGYHVDDNGDVYRYGQYRPEEKIVADIPEEQDNPPKKA